MIRAEQEIAPDLEMLDLDTGEFVRHCTWIDEETGIHCICKTQNHELKRELQYGKNIVLVYKGN